MKKGAGRRQTLWAVVLCLFQDPNTAPEALRDVYIGFHSFSIRLG